MSERVINTLPCSAYEGGAGLKDQRAANQVHGSPNVHRSTVIFSGVLRSRVGDTAQDKFRDRLSRFRARATNCDVRRPTRDHQPYCTITLSTS
jgi:hypothetical protein